MKRTVWLCRVYILSRYVGHLEHGQQDDIVAIYWPARGPAMAVVFAMAF